MKRRFELGRQPAMTKLGERRVHRVRAHGGFMKYRALKLDHGNYAWSGEAITRKCRILDVVYNATNKEFVRTKTLVKGSIVQVDATPFKNWYQKHYGVTLGKATAYVKEQKQKKLKTRREKNEADKKAKKVAESKARKEAKKAAAARAASKVTRKGKNVKGAEKKMKGSVGGKKGAADKKGADKKGAEKKGAEKKVAPKKGEKKDVKKEETAVEKKKETGKKAPVKKEGEKKGDKMQVEKKAGDKKATEKKTTPKKEGEATTEKKGKKSTEKGKKKKSKKGGKHHPSGAQTKRWRLRNATRILEAALAEQFEKGRLYAKISTSPGQGGTADGYILEGDELAFYVKRMAQKKKK